MSAGKDVPARPKRKGGPVGLKRALDELYATFDERYMRSDPLEYARRFRGRKDREIAAFVAASLAYGNAKQIRRSIEDLLWRMKPSPHKFVVGSTPRKLLDRLKGFKHRFDKDRDVACMLHFLKEALKKYGSLEAAFARHYIHSDRNTGPALTGFVEEMLTFDHSYFYRGKELPRNAGVRRFFVSPRGGSACKRLNLFLRWVVRNDKLDLGLWKKIPASKLVIPLDTHIARVARNIGLTRRKAANWKTAVEITEALKKFDPNDPIKYDFSLARPGIIGLCKKRECDNCPIRKFCKQEKMP
ncbi:MAG: TIGR02757 family protein [Planctomycetota bacterium]